MELKEYSLKTVSSTQEWAKNQISSMPPALLLVVSAFEQTEGKGRQGRSWFSPAEENLYLSFCFNIPNIEPDPFHYTQLLALVVKNELLQEGLFADFKWPNDLLINKKKISGILCEFISRDVRKYCVLGLGLNLNMSKEHCFRISQPATSLFLESGNMHDHTCWQKRIVSQFKNNLEIYLREGDSPFIEKFIDLRSPYREQPESLDAP